MKIKSQRDFWSGLMFVGLGVGFAGGASAYGFGSSAQPGPGVLPFGLGLLMALLGGVVLFKALVVETDDGDPIGRWAWRPVLAILGGLVLFGYALPKLGLVVVLPLVVVVTNLASPGFRWRQVLIQAVGLTAVTCLVFSHGLKQVMPLWPMALTS